VNAQTTAALDDLVARGRCARDVPLGRLTTYKFGGAAAYYSEPGDVGELRDALNAAQSEDMDVLVLGRGSNIVVSDQGFDGLVVRPAGRFTTLEVESDGAITAGAAVPLPRLARESVRAGRGGLEWCVGIPGSVGGAVRMNAGGHGSDTAAWLMTAEVLDAASGTIRNATPEALDLSYRHSNLSQTDVVIAATFRTTVQNPDTGIRLLREVTQWRKRHQPGGTLNAGSVFKNPAGDSAGRIIDSLGLKGLRCGGVSVSERHANFFVADETATAQDMFDLVGSVRSRIGDATGIWLEPEIRFVGGFGGVNLEVSDEPGRPG
jgi:UDP-N-acetylmuramate dehydrogenase